MTSKTSKIIKIAAAVVATAVVAGALIGIYLFRVGAEQAEDVKSEPGVSLPHVKVLQRRRDRAVTPIVNP